MGIAGAKRKRQLLIAETREKLVAMFPKTFFAKGQLKKPLKRQIMGELIARTGMKPYALKLALADYCHGPSYHVAFVAGASRVDLDGNEVEPLSDTAIEHAAAVMAQFKEETQQKWRDAARGEMLASA